MYQSLRVTNLKSEQTDSMSSDRLEILSEMQVKQDDYLIYNELDVKMKSPENESVFSVIPTTSYEQCSNDGLKIETEKSWIKVECEDMVDKFTQDPLDFSSEIKTEQCSIDLDQSEPGIKTELTERKDDANLLESDEDSDSQESRSNHSQDQLLYAMYPNCKNKKYVCNECNKAFRRRDHLDNHLRIHTGEKPFKCDICENSFNQKHHLHRHILVHSGKKPYNCDVCGKSFREKSKLKNHKLIHNGKKPFSCKECEKSFTQKHHLITHKRIHSGAKLFVCDLCDKAFTDQSNLNQHRRLHTGEKPFSCDICNKTFTRKSNLSQHKKIHKN